MKSSNSSFRVKTLVMHFTAVNYEDSVKYLVKEGGGVSSHYLIPMLNDDTYPYSSIKVLKLVDENERAWHAGVSHWQGRDGLNDTSIGIEIVNVPECIKQDTPIGFLTPRPVCIFPEFENKQIDLLIELSKGILQRNPDITPTAVVGHSDIAPSRKNDPGPRFPWQKLYESGIGAWYDNDTVAKYWNVFNKKSASIGLIQKALSTYGYKIAITGVYDRQTQDVLSAFQLHFVPWQVDGMANNQTVATLFALIEKYFPDNLIKLLDRFENETNFQELPKLVNQSDFRIELNTSNNQAMLHNSMIFVSNGIKSELSVKSTGIESADIYINEQKLNLGNYFTRTSKDQWNTEIFSIGRRTVQGQNSIRVDNIQLQPGFTTESSLTKEQSLNKNESIAPNLVPMSIDNSENENTVHVQQLTNSEQTVSKTAHLHISISYPELNKLDAVAAKNNKGLQYNFDKLERWLNKNIPDRLNGAAVVVIHRGNLVKHSLYGLAQTHNMRDEALESPIKMSNNTMLDLGRATQPMATTLAIMKLVDQGLLSLGESVTHYLSEYRGNNREVVTIADLLSHSSGYQTNVDFHDIGNPFGEYLYSLEPELTKHYLLTRVPFGVERGQQTYSDTNYMILGILIERITGMPLDEYVEKHIFEPLGLEHTLFNPLAKGKTSEQFATATLPDCENKQLGLITQKNTTCRFNGKVNDLNALYSMQGVSGHAGLFSSSDDLAVLAQLLLNEGGYDSQYLFSPQTLNAFTKPNNLSAKFGLGWKIGSHHRATFFGPYASSSAFGYNSNNGTSIIIDPNLDLAIVTFINQRPSNTSTTTKAHFNPLQIKLNSIIYETVFEAQTHIH